MNITFYKDGNMCSIEKDQYEMNKRFRERGQFVASQKPQTDKEYDEAVIYSRIYINNKYTGCIYNDKIMERLKELIKNVYSDN
jgi:thymidine kinase